MGPPTAMDVVGGVEAEVVAAFAEINEDVRDKQDILDKCECAGSNAKEMGDGRRRRIEAMPHHMPTPFACPPPPTLARPPFPPFPPQANRC
jgi:hypothetical protein